MRSSWVSSAYVIILRFCFCHTREIVFPPIAAQLSATLQQQQLGHAAQWNAHTGYHAELTGEDVSSWPEAIFAGLTTFANLPWQPCLSKSSAISHEPYDIAFLGAPFDTSTTGRPGARFGPAGVRRGAQRIVPHAAWSAYSGENSFLSWARIIDCGDAPLTFLDNTVALKQLMSAHKTISGRKANDTEKSTVPRIITLGGDHTTTLAALRATKTHWGPVTVVHFDSHIDTWDPAVLGGGLSSYAGLNHGTFLHIAHEEGLLLNDTNVHAGIRAPFVNRNHDRKNDRRCGFHIVTARELDRIGVEGVIDKIRDRVGTTNVYISVDIDVLDPAYAPGTGTAEVGGWTTRELLSILEGLEGVKIIGADVVEVAPAYDNNGETTLLAAAEVAHSQMTLMVATPVKPLVDIEQPQNDL